MNSLSKLNLNLIDAYNKGYRIQNNKIYNPKGILLKGGFDKTDYWSFNKNLNNSYCKVYVHRLVAYQKYKNKIFEDNLVVRHLDGNKHNNLENNIKLGTHQENSLDIPKNKRIELAINAAKKRRRFTDKKVKNILKDRKKGMSYRELCKKYNTIKSTLSYLFNKSIYGQRCDYGV